jgi:ATP-dependent HslUV protease ATP-binding subunit HslU
MMNKALTPHAIVHELDRFIVGQAKAKRAVAVALRNRYRRMQLEEAIRDEVTPKNIMMIGPTGVGKTEIARRMARLANAPFLKIEVTKFTQVGYVGRDVDSIVRDLVDIAMTMVQQEREASIMPQAEEHAQERLLEYLLVPKTAREIEASLDGVALPPEEPVTKGSKHGKSPSQASNSGSQQSAAAAVATQAAPVRRESPRIKAARKQRIIEALANQLLEERIIEIELDNEDAFGSVLEYMSTMSPDDSGEIMQEILTPSFGGRKRTRRVSVREARRLLIREEVAKLMDPDQLIDEATRRVEQNGIVFLDEIDKIVGARIETGPDVSGEGVQRDLLPIVEGTTIMTRYGPIKTDYILWIAAGAFHKHKPADLIPELQGRFPLRVELDSLSEKDFRAILSQPEHSLTHQYQELLNTEGVKLIFTDDGLDAMARYTCQMNERLENIGARRLHTIIEKVIEDLSFDAPDLSGQEITIDAAFVKARLDSIILDEDLSRYIL